MADNLEEKVEQEEKPVKKKKGGLIKLIIVVLIIAAVIVVAYLTGLVDMLNLSAENLTEMQNWFAALGFVGYLAYVVLYSVAAVFMLPALIFAIIAGVAFGPVLGGILALFGATIGAAIAFIVARYVARNAIVSRFEHNKLFNKIDEGIKKNGVSFLILTRLVPAFPYNVQNYIYGLTPIKFPTYVLVTFIAMAPGAFIYAFLAGEIFETLARGEQPDLFRLMIIFVAAGVILFLVSLIPKFIAKKKGINIKE